MRLFILAAMLCSVLSPHSYTAEDGAAKDPFAAGSVWMGDMRLARKDSGTGQAALTIAERNGETFKGAFVVKGPGGRIFTFEVIGTAPAKAAGPVICETPKEGLQQLKLRGKLSNGVTTLGVVGTSPFGDKGAAAIVLKQKL
jgi:L-aminopeptidase/D-esterase-like protein